MKEVKCFIIGSGPAGYTAAIYASRANLSPTLVRGIQPGGQLMITTVVENFPGFAQGVESFALMQAMEEQAKHFGADVQDGIVKKIEKQDDKYLVTLDDGTVYLAQAIIIATGASAKFLGLPAEQKFMGKGVSACATCDGFFYRKKTVAVVGGGDTACEEALYLANLCQKVYMIVRKPFLRASEIMQQRIKENEKIEILFEHVTQDILGNEKVEKLKLLKQDKHEVELPIDGLFIAIGHTPNTQFAFDGLPTDAEGYILTEPSSTAVKGLKGVFAAGDCMDKHYKQAVVAAGNGCKAALDAIAFLKEKA